MVYNKKGSLNRNREPFHFFNFNPFGNITSFIFSDVSSSGKCVYTFSTKREYPIQIMKDTGLGVKIPPAMNIV